MALSPPRVLVSVIDDVKEEELEMGVL